MVWTAGMIGQKLCFFSIIIYSGEEKVLTFQGRNVITEHLFNGEGARFILCSLVGPYG